MSECSSSNSSADGKCEFTYLAELARYVVRHAVAELKDAVCEGIVHLTVAARIAGVAHEHQLAFVANGCKDAPPDPPSQPVNLWDQFKAAWMQCSHAERKDAREQIAEFLGLEPIPDTPAGCLFPDVAKEESAAARMVPTDAEFEAFYSAFPRRVNKAKSRDAFAKAFKTLRKSHNPEQAIAVIMKGVAVYAKHADPDALCHPTTWLNGCRWDDDPAGISNGKSDQKSGTGRFKGSASDAASRSGSHGKYTGKTPLDAAVW